MDAFKIFGFNIDFKAASYFSGFKNLVLPFRYEFCKNVNCILPHKTQSCAASSQLKLRSSILQLVLETRICKSLQTVISESLNIKNGIKLSLCGINH